MAERRKKTKAEVPPGAEAIAQNELKNFMEAVNEELEHRIKHNNDALEAYFNTRCHRWLQESKGSCNRVESGYAVVLKELQK